MHPSIEADFLRQQVLMSRLVSERHQLRDGTPAIEGTDRLIEAVREVIRSYHILKQYDEKS